MKKFPELISGRYIVETMIDSNSSDDCSSQFANSDL